MVKKKPENMIAVPVAVTSKAGESQMTEVVKGLMSELESPVGVVVVRSTGDNSETKGSAQSGYSSSYARAWDEMMERRAKIKQ